MADWTVGFPIIFTAGGDSTAQAIEKHISEIAAIYTNLNALKYGSTEYVTLGTVTTGTWTADTLGIGYGGTGATTAAGARTALGLVIGTDVQAYDAGLLSIAGLTTAADKMIYTTASDTYAAADLTAAGRALIDDADAAAQRTTLGLVIGTDVQAYDADTAKTDVEQNYTAPQYSTSHDYGTVTATKTISMADGNNLKMTTTSATNLTLTASNFQVDQTGVIWIIKGGTETVSFDTTFSGLDAQDLSALATYRIPYVCEAATVTLGTAITV